MNNEIIDFTDDFDEIQKSFDALNIIEEDALMQGAPKRPSFFEIYGTVLIACKTDPRLGSSIARRENSHRLRCSSINIAFESGTNIQNTICVRADFKWDTLGMTKPAGMDISAVVFVNVKTLGCTINRVQFI